MTKMNSKKITYQLIILSMMSLFISSCSIINIFNFGDKDISTVRCNSANIGDKVKANGRVYTVVSEDQLRSLVNSNRDLSDVCTSQVTNMDELFKGKSEFNQSLAHWDVSNVTSMRSMFHGANTFNMPLENWNTSSVKDMNSLFRDAQNFNQDITMWDTRSVTNMNGLFWGASSFNQDISVWNISNVETVNFMFFEANSFAHPLTSWCFLKIEEMPKSFISNTLINENEYPHFKFDDDFERVCK